MNAESCNFNNDHHHLNISPPLASLTFLTPTQPSSFTFSHNFHYHHHHHHPYNNYQPTHSFPHYNHNYHYQQEIQKNTQNVSKKINFPFCGLNDWPVLAYPAFASQPFSIKNRHSSTETLQQKEKNPFQTTSPVGGFYCSTSVISITPINKTNKNSFVKKPSSQESVPTKVPRQKVSKAAPTHSQLKAFLKKMNLENNFLSLKKGKSLFFFIF